jgi:hypothetical protein
MPLAVAAVLVILSILIGSQAYVDGRESGTEQAGLRRENATLRADLARARTELGLERSTRAALVRQVAELNEEKTQLESRLEFFNAQSGRTGRAP